MNFTRPPLRDTVIRLGLQVKRSRCGPCPACGATVASRTDHRVPVLFTTKSWHCVACKASGGSLELVAYALGFPPPVRGQTFIRVRDWVNAGEWLPTQEVEQAPLRRIDPTPALSAAKPLSAVQALELSTWLARRAIVPTTPAGWLPEFESQWWPRGYSLNWPVVIPACSGRGEVQSMHGIAISSDAPRKTTWPKGADSRELLFADRNMRAVLRGDRPWPDRVLFVEGGTDFLTASPQMPTIGVSAGAAAALRLVRPPPTTRLYVGTDPDHVGDVYAKQIADALSPNITRRVPLHRLPG